MTFRLPDGLCKVLQTAFRVTSGLGKGENEGKGDVEKKARFC